MSTLRKWGKNKKVLYGFLVLWGIFWAYVFVFPHFYSIGNGWIAPWRAERLTWKYNSFISTGHVLSGNFLGLGPYRIYFPYIMKLFKIQDGMTMYYVAQAASGGLAMILYPILMLGCFDSVLIAMISPLVLHFTVGDMLYINKSGEYFSALWVLAIGIPLILILCNRNNEREITFYSILCMVIISISNIMRAQSGIAIFLFTILILFLKCKKKKLCIRNFIILLCMLILSYDFLGVTVPKMASDISGAQEQLAYSPWHAILIGMGYIENEYGLAYNDDIAKDMVAELYPEVEYESPEYFQCCKIIFFDFVKKDPIFVIKGLFIKFFHSIKLQFLYIMDELSICCFSKKFILCLTILGIALVLVKDRKISLFYKLIQITVIGAMLSIFSLAQCIIGIPTEYYGWGGIGGIGVTIALTFLETIKVLIEEFKPYDKNMEEMA